MNKPMNDLDKSDCLNGGEPFVPCARCTNELLCSDVATCAIDPITMPTLSEAMKFRRDQMQETQREISRRVGMSLARWQLLEKGGVPSLKEARQLYAAGIPAQVILG